MDIDVTDRPPPAPVAAPAAIPRSPSDYILAAPFRFPLHGIEEWFAPYGVLDGFTSRPPDWDGSPPMLFKIRWPYLPTISLIFGWWSQPPRSVRPFYGPAHWTLVLFSDSDDRQGDSFSDTHDCSSDRIAGWPRFARVFTTGSPENDVSVKLSFAQDALSPTQTLVPQVEFGYELHGCSEGGPGLYRTPEDAEYIGPG